MHRLPDGHVAWLRDTLGQDRGPLQLTFEDGIPEAWEYRGYPPDKVLRWLNISVGLRVMQVPQVGNVQMVNGDLQKIHLNPDYYRAGLDDGVDQWRGTSPRRPVYGLDATGALLLAIMPLVTCPKPSPAHQHL